MLRYRGVSINPLFVETVKIKDNKCTDSQILCKTSVEVIMNSGNVHHFPCKSLKEAKTIRTKIENEVIGVMQFMRYKTLL